MDLGDLAADLEVSEGFDDALGLLEDEVAIDLDLVLLERREQVQRRQLVGAVDVGDRLRAVATARGRRAGSGRLRTLVFGPGGRGATASARFSRARAASSAGVSGAFLRPFLPSSSSSSSTSSLLSASSSSNRSGSSLTQISGRSLDGSPSSLAASGTNSSSESVSVSASMG
jgi:hypothetical protein